MHIPTNTIASLLSAAQAVLPPGQAAIAGGLQDLLTGSATSADSTTGSSTGTPGAAAAAPAAGTPSSQFSSSLLSSLIDAQSWSSSTLTDAIAGRHRHHLDQAQSGESLAAASTGAAAPTTTASA